MSNSYVKSRQELHVYKVVTKNRMELVPSMKGRDVK